MVEISIGAALVAVGAGLAIGIAGALSGLGQGQVAATSVATVAEEPGMFARGIVFTALPETQAIYGFLIALLLIVFSGMMAGKAVQIDFGIVAIGAGLAIGVAAAGSALGQANAASASVGAVVEDPGMFARGIVFSALPETQAIYGFLIALLLIVFSGIMAGKAVPPNFGILAIGAGLAIGIAGALSGFGQGLAASASVGAVAEDPGMFARGIVFSALPETQAIYGFLIALLLIVFSGVMAG